MELVRLIWHYKAVNKVRLLRLSMKRRIRSVVRGIPFTHIRHGMVLFLRHGQNFSLTRTAMRNVTYYYIPPKIASFSVLSSCDCIIVPLYLIWSQKKTDYRTKSNCPVIFLLGFSSVFLLIIKPITCLLHDCCGVPFLLYRIVSADLWPTNIIHSKKVSICHFNIIFGLLRQVIRSPTWNQDRYK